MKLRILETNRDNKGTTLEKIMCILLDKMGYSVTRNEIGAGGNELDVVAKRHSNIDDILICECKAHENPICMNDWLKFLGKYYKERRNNPSVKGWMVALSDANGNVKGDIRESDYSEEVRLITGDELLSSVTDAFQMGGRNDVQKMIASWCKKVVVDYDIAFYQETPYWIAYFTDGSYTMFDKDAGFLDSSVTERLTTLFTSVTTYTIGQFCDIRKDKVLALKRQCIKTVAYWTLMSGDRTLLNIAGDVVDSSGNTIHPSDAEIYSCLKDSGFVEMKDDRLHLKPFLGEDKVLFYRELLQLGIPMNLYNEYYYNNIDDKLLDEILRIQDSVKLKQEERKLVLFLLKHSPSALRVALYPNNLFKPRVRVENVDASAYEESVKSTFIQTLAHCMEVDSDSDIAMLLFDKLEIRDFYRQTIYSVVTKDGNKMDFPVSKRLYYIPFEDSDGGSVIQASHDFVGKYDSKTGYMIGGKKKIQKEKTLFGIVKHRTGEGGEEYLSLYD